MAKTKSSPDQIKPKIIQELEKEKTPEQIGQGLEGFIKATQKFRHIPRTQFDHAFSLLADKPEKIEDFSDLINTPELLGNIENSRLLRFYQNDVYFLSSFFEMSKRSKTMKGLFDWLFFAWLLEISLTRSLKGLERELQAFRQVPVPRKPIRREYEPEERRQRAKEEVGSYEYE